MGEVVVLHNGTGRAFYAENGNPIYKDDTIFTLAESRCRIKLTTEDIITLGDNTRIDVAGVLDDRKNKTKQSIFNMLRGKAMFYVVRLFRYRKIKTAVKTHTAVMGVRGTQFGIEVRQKQDQWVRARPVYVAGISKHWPQYAATGTRRNSETILHVFKGRVTAVSSDTGIGVDEFLEKPLRHDDRFVKIGSGQSRKFKAGGAGPIISTPPGVAEQFIKDTYVPEPGGNEQPPTPTTDDPQRLESQTLSDLNQPPPPPTALDLNPTLAGSFSSQGYPTNRLGYFSGMLYNLTFGQFWHLYLSHSIQNFDSTATAQDSLIGQEVVMDASDPDHPRIAYLGVENGGTVTFPGVPYSIQHGEIGHTGYMEWGWWKQTFAMTGTDGYDYAFTEKGYAITGDVTSPQQMEYLKNINQEFHYSGGAEATYMDDTGDMAEMSGEFDADVNFSLSSDQITDFDLNVSGGGHMASISNEKGSFTDSSNPSHFVMPTGSGTWKIDGVTSGSSGAKQAFGSMYGPGGIEMGGVFKIDAGSGTEKHVTGVFHGQQQK
jgi:hypothetical protein